MKEVIVVMMWDNNGSDVYTRPVVLNKKTKALKFKGRKANKVIIPESLTDVKLLQVLKSATAYNCNVVRAIGR